MKPGVSSSAPPKITSAPSSTSRAGTRPSAIAASLKRRHVARPWWRISIEPRIESAISSAIVHQHADRLADLDDHGQLGDRDER